MPSPSKTAKDFDTTSPSETPTIIHVSFASDPTASLGAKILPCNNDSHMFLPGFAVIGKVYKEGMAIKAGVQVGDVLVAVNGKGFRRFAPDYEPDTAAALRTTPDVKVDMDHRVMPADEEPYDKLLETIKSFKMESTADTPLVITLERYTWDARPHAWGRFLTARDGDVQAAMTMWQNHQQWKVSTFPISLVTPGLQRILRQRAISEIHVPEIPATVYVNYGTLMKMLYANEITPEDIVLAFVLFTERMLGRTEDPRAPKTCQFIDLANVTYSSGFRTDVLKIIYTVFEPNYPEALSTLVMYPSSTVFSTTARGMLSFVNAKTRQKFVITGKIEKACEALGWSTEEVEQAGGMAEYMHSHETLGTSLMIA